MATRLSLKAFKSIKAGVHFLRVKDDFSEIKRSVPGTSTFAVDSTLDSIPAGDYSYSVFSQLATALGDSIIIPEKNWNDGTPLENIVFGFDFEKALDNRKLLFQMAWNMSWTNTNIWDGALSLEEADVLLDSLDNDSLMNIPIKDFPEPANYENIITKDPVKLGFCNEKDLNKISEIHKNDDETKTNNVVEEVSNEKSSNENDELEKM